LNSELEELKKSEESSKKILEDKMKKTENEFIEKQKMTVDLERKKAAET